MAGIKAELTAERLREVIDYSPETGEFIRKITTSKTRWKPGCAAGTTSKTGRVSIQVDHVLYFAHRLAWLYVYGRWPKGILDHANGDPSDNRIENLREALWNQNKANSRLRHDNASGFKGAYLTSNGRYCAQIRYNSKLITIGRYETAEEAHSAYFAKAQQLFGEFARAR